MDLSFANGNKDEEIKGDQSLDQEVTVESEKEEPKPLVMGSDDTEWIENALSVIEKFNEEPVKALFDRFSAKIADFSKIAETHEVKDKNSMDRAIEMGLQLKGLAGTIEKKRVELKAPYLNFGRVIDGYTKSVISALEKIQDGLKVKIKPVMKRLKDEEAARAKKEREEYEAALAERKKEGAPLPPKMKAPKKQPARTQTEIGSSGIKKTWVFEVIDINKVPRELMIIDEKRVNAMIKGGKVKKIPGLKIYEKEDVDLRSKRS